jgi:LPS-assembly protein
LLLPGVGYSDKRGFQYSAAYYQVLGVNQDATLYLDYLSQMGVGKGLEYRYIFGADNAGEARLYHIDIDQGDERYAAAWRHDGTLPGQVRLLADVKYVNDNDYFSDFGGIAGEYNKDSLESKLFLSRHWGRYSLVGEFRYTQDLETEADTTLQLLPRIVFDTSRQLVAETPLYYRFASEYSHFWREEGLRGERLMLRPAAGVALPLGHYVDLDSEIAWRERYYWNLSDDSDNDNSGSVEISTQLSMMPLQKEFVRSKSSWQHLVWPEVFYQYIPDVDQEKLPDFDAYDRIAEENHLEYALVQRLVKRFTTSEGVLQVRDYAYLRFGLLHDLRSEGAGQRFTDLRSELQLHPTEWFTLRSDATLNTDAGQWDKFAAEISIDDEKENTLSARYRYDREEAIEYAAATLSVAYLKPVYLKYQQRYDLASDYDLEQEVALEYRHQCWGVTLTMRDRKDDRSFMLSFSLSGLGSVGGKGGNSAPGGI